MPSAPLSPAMPSEPNVLPVSPAPGSAASITSAVPGPLPNVAHSTPARQPQALTGPSSTVQSVSKLLSDIGALPSDPDVENAPSECNPPLTDRAFRYQRRDACRAFFFVLFSFISLIADGPHHYHPACGHKGSSHLSPVYALQCFYRDASSALLQLVNRWLNFTYSRSHAFRYERKNTNPTLVRIALTTSVLADVQLTY